MRAQSARYGFLVYIFHGDALRMKQKCDSKWNLYGLWTHSSSPVVQYIRKTSEEGEKSEHSVERLGLELLGQCLPHSNKYRQDIVQPRRHHDRWLVIYNDGEKLEAELHQRSGLAPARCFIKELPMQSPFSFDQSRSTRETSFQHRSSKVASAQNFPVDTSRERQPGSSGIRQWYSKPDGEEILRNIHNYCVDKFSKPSMIQMSRDAESQNLELSIDHTNKTFTIRFPIDFPQRSAQLVYSTAVHKNIRLREAKTKEAIVEIIQESCSCYQCKVRR